MVLPVPRGLQLVKVYKALTHTVTTILRLDEDYNEAYGLRKPESMVIKVGEWVTCPGDPFTQGLLGCQPGLRLYIHDVVRVVHEGILVNASMESPRQDMTCHCSLYVPSGFGGLLTLYPLLSRSRAWEGIRRLYGVHADVAEFINRVLRPVGGSFPEAYYLPPIYYNRGLAMVGGKITVLSITPGGDWVVEWGGRAFNDTLVNQWPRELVSGLGPYVGGRIGALSLVSGSVPIIRGLLGL